MSNAERFYIGLCGFYAFVVAYWVFVGRDRVLIVLNTLLLGVALLVLFGHRRRRQQRDRDKRGSH